jgi:hypothetical protein
LFDFDIFPGDGQEEDRKQGEAGFGDGAVNFECKAFGLLRQLYVCVFMFGGTYCIMCTDNMCSRQMNSQHIEDGFSNGDGLRDGTINF